MQKRNINRTSSSSVSFPAISLKLVTPRPFRRRKTSEGSSLKTAKSTSLPNLSASSSTGEAWQGQMRRWDAEVEVWKAELETGEVTVTPRREKRRIKLTYKDEGPETEAEEDEWQDNTEERTNSLGSTGTLQDEKGLLEPDCVTGRNVEVAQQVELGTDRMEELTQDVEDTFVDSGDSIHSKESENDSWRPEEVDCQAEVESRQIGGDAELDEEEETRQPQDIQVSVGTEGDDNGRNNEGRSESGLTRQRTGPSHRASIAEYVCNNIN